MAACDAYASLCISSHVVWPPVLSCRSTIKARGMWWARCWLPPALPCQAVMQRWLRVTAWAEARCCSTCLRCGKCLEQVSVIRLLAGLCLACVKRHSRRLLQTAMVTMHWV